MGQDHFSELVSIDERSLEGAPIWDRLAFLFEYDSLPEAVQLAAQSRAHLCAINLRPTDSPVVNHETDNDTGAHNEGSATTDAASAKISPLTAMASALREVHGGAYDDLIDVSALARAQEAAAVAAAHGAACQEAPSTIDRRGQGSLQNPTGTGAGTGASSGASAGAVMVGDELLRFPEIHALLRRRRVPLIECSAALPHLIIDHESGVLILDLPTLRQPGAAAAMVAHCEVSYRSLWLVVLDNEKDPSSAVQRCERSQASVSGGGSSSEAWARVRLLLAELCATPLKLSVRVVRRTERWSILRQIFSQRAPEPFPESMGGAATSAMDAEAEESQHAAFLSLCGLNPWAARLITQHFSLRDLLGLRQELRKSHFSWIPERALRVFGFVADGGDDDEEAALSANGGDPPMVTRTPHVDAASRYTQPHEQALPSWQTPPPLPSQLSLSTHPIADDGQRQLCWLQTAEQRESSMATTHAPLRAPPAKRGRGTARGGRGGGGGRGSARGGGLGGRGRGSRAR
jgi:hypothetical protein